MNKIVLFIIICLCLGIGLIAIAQDETNDETNTTEETITAEDLEIKDPKLLPDNPFYFLKNWGRAIRSLFTFGKIEKLELESEYANERLMEMKKMTEQNKNRERIEKATKKYEKTLEKIRTRSEKIKETAEDNPKLKSFLEKYTNQQILHQTILEKLENQVPTETFEKIKEARKKHLDGFENVMNKLENKEKAKERFDEALKKIKKGK